MFPNVNIGYNVSSLKVNWNEERSSMVLSSFEENVSTWLFPLRKETWMHIVIWEVMTRSQRKGEAGKGRVKEGNGKVKKVNYWAGYPCGKLEINPNMDILKNYMECISEASLWREMWGFSQQLMFPIDWELPYRSLTPLNLQLWRKAWERIDQRHWSRT